jgi:hypothetical protein
VLIDNACGAAGGWGGEMAVVRSGWAWCDAQCSGRAAHGTGRQLWQQQEAACLPASPPCLSTCHLPTRPPWVPPLQAPLLLWRSS